MPPRRVYERHAKSDGVVRLQQEVYNRKNKRMWLVRFLPFIYTSLYYKTSCECTFMGLTSIEARKIAKKIAKKK